MGDDLIDAYVDELRTALRWRSDVDDITAEAEDHLRQTAARLERDGTSTSEAQSGAIAGFGHPLLVARAHAVGRGDHLAVPTAGTRVAGGAALAAALLWLAVPLLWWASDVTEDATGEWIGTPQLLGNVGALCLLSALALTTLTAAGLVSRHGGLGPAGVASLVLLGLGTFMGVAGWFLAGWMLIAGAGAALLAVAVGQRRLAPPWPTALLGSGLLIGLIAFLLARAMELGSADEWGDYRSAQVIGLALAAILAAAGLAGIGWWLLGERAAPRQVLAAR